MLKASTNGCYKSWMHNSSPQAGPGLRTGYIRPSQQVKKYKKLIVNGGDFIKEFKLHWTINNLLQSKIALMYSLDPKILIYKHQNG